MSIISMHQQ